MLAVERRKQILEQVHKDKKVIVSELSRQFRVSEETIRRDLEKLAEDGHVIKSYGGAVINEIGSIDLPFNVRWKSNSIGKQKIADLISQEIQDGEQQFLLQRILRTKRSLQSLPILLRIYWNYRIFQNGILSRPEVC